MRVGVGPLRKVGQGEWGPSARQERGHTWLRRTGGLVSL